MTEPRKKGFHWDQFSRDIASPFTDFYDSIPIRQSFDRLDEAVDRSHMNESERKAYDTKLRRNARIMYGGEREGESLNDIEYMRPYLEVWSEDSGSKTADYNPYRKYFPEAPGPGPWALPEEEKAKTKKNQGSGSSQSKPIGSQTRQIDSLNLESTDSSKTIEELKNLMNLEREQVDLGPLMQLSDMWFGGNLAQGYSDPFQEKRKDAFQDAEILTKINALENEDIKSSNRNSLSEFDARLKQEELANREKDRELRTYFDNEKLNIMRGKATREILDRQMEAPESLRKAYSWFDRESNNWKSPVSQDIKEIVEMQRGDLDDNELQGLYLDVHEDILGEMRDILSREAISPREAYNRASRKIKKIIQKEQRGIEGE